MTSSRALFFLLILSALVAVVAASGPSTEADFRRMKIKDLKTYLSDRGLECVGCQEKSDFVLLAYQNRNAKPASTDGKRIVPDAPFWDAWRDNAMKECAAAVKKRGNDPDVEPYKHICEVTGHAVDSFLSQHGRRVASKLKKTPKDLLKTSYKGVYYDAGIKLLQRLADYCLATPERQKKCESLGFVMDALDHDDIGKFKEWTTNVGIENTNPMYEIISGR